VHTAADEVKWLSCRLSHLTEEQILAERHAIGIHHTLIAQRFRTRTAGHDLGTGERVESKDGVMEELKTLRRAAKTGSNRQFIKAWARAGFRAHQLIWPRDVAREHLKSGRCQAFVSSPDDPLLVINAPLAADAVALVEQAIASVGTQPAGERRRRQGDAAIDDIIKAIAQAYRALTGHRAGLTYKDLTGEWGGCFLDLCRDIGLHFSVPQVYSISRLRRVTARRRSPLTNVH
jgi:hypothetical protein